MGLSPDSCPVLRARHLDCASTRGSHVTGAAPQYHPLPWHASRCSHARYLSCPTIPGSSAPYQGSHVQPRTFASHQHVRRILLLQLHVLKASRPAQARPELLAVRQRVRHCLAQGRKVDAARGGGTPRGRARGWLVGVVPLATSALIWHAGLWRHWAGLVPLLDRLERSHQRRSTRGTALRGGGCW